MFYACSFDIGIITYDFIMQQKHFLELMMYMSKIMDSNNQDNCEDICHIYLVSGVHMDASSSNVHMQTLNALSTFIKHMIHNTECCKMEQRIIVLR